MSNPPKDSIPTYPIKDALSDEFLRYGAKEPQKLSAIVALFSELDGRMDHTPLWIVDALEGMVRTLGRGAIVDALRALESLGGLGTFVVGRRGQPSRFQWREDPHNVTGALEILTAQDATSRLRENLPAAPSEAPELLNHHFRLRPNLTVELRLPENLTSTEAARLADFIKTLPFAP